MTGPELVAIGAICVLLVGGVVALAVVLGKAQAAAERKRRQAFSDWAKPHGWFVTANPVVDWPARLPGHNARGVTLVLSGPMRGHQVLVGEYAYTESHTSTSSDGQGGTTTSTHTTTHRYVVVVVRLTRPGPSMAVYPRGAFSRLGRALFGDSATALGHEEFDRRFRIVTREPDAARRVLGPALVAAHLAGSVPAWNLHGHDLLTYQSGTLGRDPQRVPGFAEPLLRVAELLGR